VTFPAGLTLVTVHGRADQFPLGGSSGLVEFTARYALVGPVDDSIVMPFTAAVVLDDTNGEFTIALPATDDPDWTPTGWAYAVRITAGGTAVRGTLQLDYLSTSVELADLIQIDGTAETGQTYIPLSQRSIAGGVAGLDADGDVIDAAGDKVTGGGGGGGDVTLSSTVVSATSYGTSASAGTATSVSRGDHTHGSHAAPASTDISDATTTGKAVLTAASAAAARTAISAETSGAAATALTTAETYADTAVATHSADTTAVHGITDTSALVVTTDSRLSDARTPAAHASSHGSAGADPVSLNTSQITAGSLAIARIPTGSSSSTVAIGNDSRLSDSRTPTAHASSHGSAGSDAVSLNASQITAGTLVTAQGGTGLGSFTSGNFVSASSTSALATTKAVPTGTVVGTTDTQTLTNKTLTAPAISSPTGLAKADVGLGSVDNVADSGKPVSTAQQAAIDAVIKKWNGSAYVSASGAAVYVGPSDPGSVADGSVWISTS
jgi:hypothetical protein